MTWVKLEEHFVDHRKVLTAGPLAGWMFVAGLCYANRLLTNGFIPENAVEHLVSLNGSRRQEPAKLAQKLCDVELWKAATVKGHKGFQIHDFLKYQPSRKQVLHEREMAKQRQARFRRGA